MKQVAVLVATAHSDSDDAIRSVSAAMKRAGYEVVDYHAWSDGGTEEVCVQPHGVLFAHEPEVDSADLD